MNWLTTEAVEVLEIVEQPVEDRQQEYMVSVSSRRYKLRTEKIFTVGNFFFLNL